jgi:hypothetical protein
MTQTFRSRWQKFVSTYGWRILLTILIIILGYLYINKYGW